ncbi:MAG: hypothetical protein AAGD33_04785 [Actinomycetota bacterium]
MRDGRHDPADRAASRSAGPFSILAVVASALIFAGCLTGERPFFEEEAVAATSSTGDAAIDEVLELLERVDASSFTAGFDIERRFGPVQSVGTVVVDGPDRQSITVRSGEREIRFINDDGGRRTCDLVSGTCEAAYDVQQVSDTVLTPGFYGPDYARRLRRDANARIGTSEGYTESIAGQAAQCVDVTVTGGVKTYCALASGVLAKFDGADFVIDLTSYSPVPDDAQFDV